MTGFVLCAGPGAVIIGDVDPKCSCTLDNTRFYEETNRCDCYTEINGQETGLVYNADINRCGCSEEGQFITPQGTSFDCQLDTGVTTKRSKSESISK